MLPLLSGCEPTQVRFNNRMEGSWNMARETIVRINPDGTVDELANRVDAGIIEFSQDEFDNFFVNYSISLNYDPFRWTDKSFKTDEKNKRAIFYNFYCEDLFGCDMIATIETNERDRQIWSFYRSLGAGAHRKTTWTLVRM